MELEKLQITGYTDADFSKTNGGQFEVQINPASLKITKGIRYDRDDTPGEEKKSAKYKYHEPSQLSFDIVLDDTGVVPGKKKEIKVMVQDLEKALYKINAESHEPAYSKITWGKLVFNGRLSALNYDYTLFAPNGTALRLKVALSFTEHSAKDTAIKNSPDMSRLITFKAGDSIAHYCNEIYGDAAYSYDVAAYNNLETFRNIKPGTKVLFPPLTRK